MGERDSKGEEGVRRGGRGRGRKEEEHMELGERGRREGGFEKGRKRLR